MTRLNAHPLHNFLHTGSTLSSRKPNTNTCLISSQAIDLSRSMKFILTSRGFLVEHLLLPDPSLSGDHWNALLLNRSYTSTDLIPNTGEVYKITG